MKSRLTCLVLLLSLVFSACQTEAPLQGNKQIILQQETDTPVVNSTVTPESDSILALELEITDPEWDGEKVPSGQQCNRQGGENPSTPRVRINNIPEEADAIIMEFSDRDYRPMDNGGHGKVGFKILEGTTEIEIPSIPGHSFDLPEGFFLVQEHKAATFDTAGAYMPPCSGGSGHSYYVTVKAVKLLSKEDMKFVLLGQGILELGKY